MPHLPGPSFWIFFGTGMALFALACLVFLLYLGKLDEADQAARDGVAVTRTATEQRQFDQYLAAEADALSPRQQFRQDILDARHWRGGAAPAANDLDGFAQLRPEVRS